MEIVHYPHPALKWKSKPVQEIDNQLRTTVKEMLELMYAHKGVGLAANQVALPYRLFVMNPSGDPEVKEDEFVLINPEIIARKGSEVAEEGCLSLPEVYGDVPRAKEIVVEAFDLQGNCFELRLSELPARVVQHEYDHIDGVMFFERMAVDAVKPIQHQIDNFIDDFHRQQEQGEFPNDAELKKQLRALEP